MLPRNELDGNLILLDNRRNRFCFSLFQLERPSCRRSADLQPRPPPGRAYRPRPRPLLRPPAEGRSVRARPRSRPGSASGARSVWLVPPCCCGCEKAVAEAQPVETLQRPRRCPPPARAGRLEGWRRPCRDGPRHVLQPDFLVKPSNRKSSSDKLYLFQA
ncbi:hypothetical protein R6Z07F_015288 [Ovis aries]